ncbi:MAG: GrpB family protein [Cyanobacteria bacterium P01_G01_bin.54]
MPLQYISEYNPDWPQRFKQIADRLQTALPADCQIHHVGSTAIPRMPAKDIIDVDIQCPSGQLSQVIEVLEKLGYSHEGDQGIPGREAFRPVDGPPATALPAHHLYVCETEAAELHNHLAFRDYLLESPGRAHWLGQQKRLADQKATSRSEYIANKANAYEVINQQVQKWRQAR